MAARIIQLTDLHLMEDPRAELKGIRTRERLGHVLRAVRSRFSQADRLVLTGDLTHDERLATYQALRHLFDDWIPRLRMVPGNHDERLAMSRAFPECLTVVGGRNVFSEKVGGWRLIGLDSHLPGELRGRVGEDQRAWLARELTAAGDDPVCLFVHHPPVAVNSAWLDGIGLEDAVELIDMLRRASRVRLVACGHVHQELTCRDDDSLLVVTSPSTGVQFRPETERLEVDASLPGFRVIDLLEGGRVRTRVERVPMAGPTADTPPGS